MRILLVVPHDEETGGVASVVGNLAKYFVAGGHKVLFFHPTANFFLRRRTTSLGFAGFNLRLQMPYGERPPIISILAFVALFPLAMCQLILLIRWYKIQIINIHYPAENFYYFALCRRLLSVSLITSVHGADVFPDGHLKRPSSRAFRSILLASDAIVAPSKRFRQDFLAAYPELSGTTTFIHNGVNPDEISQPSRSNTRVSHERYILCISAYKQQKAIDVLLRAFQKVHHSEPSVKLVLVGGGPLRETLQDLASSLGICGQVEFLGRKEHGDAMRLLCGCDVFVLPSRFETFGIVILEAWACRKPVVATMAGGISEVIEHRKNGTLVPPDDPNALAQALLTLLQDQQLKLTLAHNGHATLIERFLSNHTGAKYETVFTDLMRAPQRQAA